MERLPQAKTRRTRQETELHEEEEEEEQTNSDPDNQQFGRVLEEDLLDQYEEQKGLKTGTKPEKVNLSAPRASEEVEAFLTKLMKTLLERAEKIKTHETEDLRSVAIKELQQSLQQDDRVAVIPTDKTNSFRVVLVEDYIKWINQHLKKSAKVIPKDKLDTVVKQGKDLLKKKRHILSSKGSQVH